MSYWMRSDKQQLMDHNEGIHNSLEMFANGVPTSIEGHLQNPIFLVVRQDTKEHGDLLVYRNIFCGTQPSYCF